MDLPGIFDIAPLPVIALGGVIALAVLGALGYLGWRLLHGVPLAVIGGGCAALACTAYSGDSSWRFAIKMGMNNDVERTILFGAAELALLAMIFMARKNLNGKDASPGVPGTVSKIIVGVQIIPAFEISNDLPTGVVRAFFGPILAMVIWHQVLGIDLRHNKPEAEAKTMLAQLGRAARTRLFVYLGIDVLDRTAQEITQERNMANAVELTLDLYYRYERWPNSAPATKLGRLVRRRRLQKQRKAVSRACAGNESLQRELTRRVSEGKSANKLAQAANDNTWGAKVTDPVAYALCQQVNLTFKTGIERAKELPAIAPPQPEADAPQRRTSAALDSIRARMRKRGMRVPDEPKPKIVLFPDAAEEPAPIPEQLPRRKAIEAPVATPAAAAAGKKGDDDPDPEPPKRPLPKPTPVVAPKPAPATEPDEATESHKKESASGSLSSRAQAAQDRKAAEELYLKLLDEGTEISGAELGKRFDYTSRWGSDRVNAAKEQRTAEELYLKLLDEGTEITGAELGKRFNQNAQWGNDRVIGAMKRRHSSGRPLLLVAGKSS
ncbi:hypothetical protein [Streptomyces noursei]